MPIKSIAPTMTFLLMVFLLTTNAMAIQIKCPPADFIKKKLTKKLNRVTRVEINKFVVTYWDSVPDENNQRWSLDVFVDTATDHDYNGAFKEARHRLLHEIDHPTHAYLEYDGDYCTYVDKNDNAPYTLVFHEKAGETPNALGNTYKYFFHSSTTKFDS